MAWYFIIFFSVQCDPRHEGIFCESDVFREKQFDTTYVFLIIDIIVLCFSVLNNSLSLELFIRCRRIRHTNCGIYLIIYYILSLVSSILLAADQAVQYYPNRLINNGNQYEVFDCYVSKIGYNMLADLCIWFSLCIVFERGLIICFNGKINASRWRSCAMIIIIFAIAGGSARLLIYSKVLHKQIYL
jgi:hypothetical protein